MTIESGKVEASEILKQIQGARRTNGKIGQENNTGKGKQQTEIKKKTGKALKSGRVNNKTLN